MFCRSLSQKRHKSKISNKQTYAKHKNNTFKLCNRKKRLCKKRVRLHGIRRFKKTNKKCIKKQWRREVRKLGNLIRLLKQANQLQQVQLSVFLLLIQLLAFFQLSLQEQLIRQQFLQLILQMTMTIHLVLMACLMGCQQVVM